MAGIERLSEIVVARACGFAGLGIVAVMVGLSFDFLLSVKSGAILLSMMTAVLHFFAQRAPTVPYKRTEVWLMTDADNRPAEGSAQHQIGTALQAAYRRFALYAGIGAATLWALALLLILIDRLAGA